MSRNLPYQSLEHQELKCEPKSPLRLSCTGEEQARQPRRHDTFGGIQRPHTLRCEGEKENPGPLSNDAVVIDLTEGDEVVILPHSAPSLHDRAISSESRPNALPDRVAKQLDNWYANMGRLVPPPCAVSPLIAKSMNPLDSSQPALWSYKGLEEMSVKTYELDGFKDHKNHHLIIAQGPTKGPFIIARLQDNLRDSPIVPFYIWEGWKNLGPEHEGFESSPSIIQRVKLPNNDHLAEVSEFILPPQSPSQPRLPFQWTQNALAANKAHENARGPVLGASTSRSSPRSSGQQSQAPKQLGNDYCSVSSMGLPMMSQSVKATLPKTSDPNTLKDVATNVPHPKPSIPRYHFIGNVPAPTSGIAPPTISPVPALTKPQSTAKEPIQALLPMKQQMPLSIDRPNVPRLSPQSEADEGSDRSQRYQVEGLEFCHTVVTELMDEKHLDLNQPFLQPVDPIALGIPTYFEVIKQPMDLSTIQQKLVTGKYQNAENFEDDVTLMFWNCRKFNKEGDPVYKCGQLLNEIFDELWARRGSVVQDDPKLRDMNVHKLGEDPHLILPQEAPLTRDTLTPPTTPPICQGPVMSDDNQNLIDDSNPRNNPPVGASLDGQQRHEIANHVSPTRPTSPLLSELDWGTLRSSREASYTSEMLIEMEHEFSRSEQGSHRASNPADNSAQECLKSDRKRKRASASEATDVSGDASVKRTLTMHPSQTPPEAQSQVRLEEAHSDPLSEDLFVSNLRNRGVPWRVVHQRYEEAFGATKSVASLQSRHYELQNRRVQCFSVNRLARTDHNQSETDLSKIQRTFSPVKSDLIQTVRGQFSEPSEELSGSEYYESPDPPDKSTKNSLSRLRCSYDVKCRKTFTTQFHLDKHIKTAHVRKANKVCQHCGRRYERANHLTLYEPPSLNSERVEAYLPCRHLKHNRCPARRQLNSGKHMNQDQACEPHTSTGEIQPFSALSYSATEQDRSDKIILGPECSQTGASLPSIGENVASRDDIEGATELVNTGTHSSFRSENDHKSMAVTDSNEDQAPEEEELQVDRSMDLLQQPTNALVPQPPYEETQEPQCLPTEQDSDMEDSAGEISDQGDSSQDHAEAGFFDFDQDPGSEAKDVTKLKIPLEKLPLPTALKNPKSPVPVSPQDRANSPKEISGKRECARCKKFNLLRDTKPPSSETDCYVCTSCVKQERLEEGSLDGKGRCVDCNGRKYHSDWRIVSVDGDYICGDCQTRRDSHEGQCQQKFIKARPRGTNVDNKRCDDCGGDKGKSNWRRNPDREGGYLCLTCAAYLKKNKVHRRPNEKRPKNMHEAHEETTFLYPNQERSIHRLPTASEPLEQEIYGDDELNEIRAFPSLRINRDQLRDHIKENVMFLFYTPTGKKSAAKPFSKCETGGKLLGQAIGAKVFGLADEMLKPQGNVLKICFGAGQSGVGEDLRVIEDDEDSFDELVEAIEQRGWWKVGDKGVISGSGILEVRACGPVRY